MRASPNVLHKGFLKVLALFITLALCPQAGAEAGSPYKPFTGTLLFGEPYSTKETEIATSVPVPGRIALLNTIVIDPGHGGEDPGALGPTGLQEKGLALRAAKALKRLLQTGLGSHVFLTREDDSTLSPEQRAGIANNLKADLFISIHAAASPEKSMKGLEIYLPADRAKTPYPSIGQIAKKVAGQPRQGVDEVATWGAVHLKYLPLSRLLGRLIQLNMSQEMNREVTVRELPMLTLKGVNMPSLELDLGYITDFATETELKSDVHINRLAAAVYRGIKQYKETLLLFK